MKYLFKPGVLSPLAGAGLLLVSSFGSTGCTVHGSAAAETGAPPPPIVEHEGAGEVARVEHAEPFPLVAAERYEARPALSVTGVVSPDVARSVPVVSLASGRVVDLRARLGDSVQQGQLLLRIRSADISGAFSDYRHAVADKQLSGSQLDRAKALYERGAIAQKDLEVAQDADEKAAVDLETAGEHLRVMGVDPKTPTTGIVDVVSPVSGVITEQNVTNAAGVKSLDNSPNLFTISDLSRVWILCDVYENDLASVKVGDDAEIRLAAYPDRTLKGRVSNILPILDPAIRTGKVRVEVENPGLMRLGMFVTATFRGQTRLVRAAVPAAAILHLHDRDWVYEPEGPLKFRRVEVVSGDTLPGGRQEVRSGLEPGQRVVSNALVLQNTVEQ
jgi:cobalt-zinc-cadmium efflux system membrane fusion protein